MQVSRPLPQADHPARRMVAMAMAGCLSLAAMLGVMQAAGKVMTARSVHTTVVAGTFASDQDAAAAYTRVLPRGVAGQ